MWVKEGAGGAAVEVEGKGMVVMGVRVDRARWITLIDEHGLDQRLRLSHPWLRGAV